jgi:hypothetical protein
MIITLLIVATFVITFATDFHAASNWIANKSGLTVARWDVICDCTLGIFSAIARIDTSLIDTRFSFAAVGDSSTANAWLIHWRAQNVGISLE